MDSREILKILKRDGWVVKRISGSHNHLIHSIKKGLVTIPHPKRDLPLGTIKSIERQAGIKLLGGK